MSEKELDRISIFKAILAKRLKVLKAAKHLGLSTRQVKRLKNDLRQKVQKDLFLKRSELKAIEECPQVKRNL